MLDLFALVNGAANGHLEIVKHLVGQDVNIHAADCALEWSARNGHLDVVKYLMEQDTRSNIDYILIISARYGHLEIVKFLIERGVNIHVGCDDALVWSVKNGHLNVVEYLIENGADIHCRNNYLFENIAKYKPEIANYLKY